MCGKQYKIHLGLLAYYSIHSRHLLVTCATTSASLIMPLPVTKVNEWTLLSTPKIPNLWTTKPLTLLGNLFSSLKMPIIPEVYWIPTCLRRVAVTHNHYSYLSKVCGLFRCLIVTPYRFGSCWYSISLYSNQSSNKELISGVPPQ